MSDRKHLRVSHKNYIFRDCLASILSSDCGYDASSIDYTQSDDVNELIGASTDALLLDLNLPDNLTLEFCQTIRQQQRQTKVVLLVPDQQDRLVQCVAAGAHGCVPEHAPLVDLDRAISRVLAGESYCSLDMIGSMFNELSQLIQTPVAMPTDDSSNKRLTAREKEVLALLCRRKSNKEIAKELNVSLFTVKSHVGNILKKLNAESRNEAVEIARHRSDLYALGNDFKTNDH